MNMNSVRNRPIPSAPASRAGTASFWRPMLAASITRWPSRVWSGRLASPASSSARRRAPAAAASRRQGRPLRGRAPPPRGPRPRPGAPLPRRAPGARDADHGGDAQGPGQDRGVGRTRAGLQGDPGQQVARQLGGDRRRQVLAMAIERRSSRGGSAPGRCARCARDVANVRGTGGQQLVVQARPGWPRRPRRHRRSRRQRSRRRPRAPAASSSNVSSVAIRACAPRISASSGCRRP